MIIAVIIVACAIANAMQCQTISPMSVHSVEACVPAAEMWWEAQPLIAQWEVRDIKCEPWFEDEDHG